MKKSLNLILILTTSLVLTSAVDAAVLNSDFIKKQIKTNIEAELNNLNIKKADIKINKLPYKNINIPEGKVEIKTSKNIRNYSYSSILKTDILVDGLKVKSFGVPVEIKVYDKVWVLKDNLKKNSSLSYSNLALEEKQINIFSKDALKKDFQPIGYLTTKNLKSEAILTTKNIKRTPFVVKNSPVSIMFKTPYVNVTLPGMAMEEGNMGDYIRVKNDRYRKNFVGKIVGKNIIKVNI